MMLALILLLATLVTAQEEDGPLGEGLVIVQATCDMPISSCVSPPCRYVCPVECTNVTVAQTFTMNTQVCRETRYLLSLQNAVDIIMTQNDSISVVTSIHSMSIARRNSQPYCPGSLELANGASICIITCASPDYECPSRYKQRCACPSSKPILKDAIKGVCVENIKGCPPYNSYILPRRGLEKFIFVKQPVDMTRKRGDSVRLECVVSGNTNYRYFWYKANKMVAGSHAITRSSDPYLQETGKSYLDISSLQPSDAGFYHCIVRTGDSITVRDAKYSLVSNSGYLRVEYFDMPENPTTMEVSSQANAISVILPCDLPGADPVVEATWYKGEMLVSDKRMFVVPTDTENAKKGSLYIMMVRSDDEDVYTCKTAYGGETYIVSKIRLDVAGQIGQPKQRPEIVVDVTGRSKVGETATFFCAGIGNPVPSISWSNNNVRLETSDNIRLEDFKRRLIISNVQAQQPEPYKCTVSSGDNGSKETRKTLLYLAIEPSTFDIKFTSTPASHTILPNRYTPFTLQCAIVIDSIVDYAPTMYWIKNGATLDMKPSSRIRANSTDVVVDGTTIRNSTLIFDTPNESDMGIYQCVVENKAQMRQATAYVNVEKPPGYDVYYEQAYYVNTSRVQVSEAEDYCRTTWHPKGHLVTIMNKNESETVFRLMAEQGIPKAWIGLTSENPTNKPGIWSWTSQRASSDFSYWYLDNPDNALGNETYAIMDITKAGHWFDVKNGARYPFVCSRYTARCPTVAKFFNNSATPVVRYEEDGTTYEVGTTLTVTCVDKMASQISERVVCNALGEFEPGTLPCPIRSRGHVTRYISHVIFVMVTSYFLVS